MGHPLGMRCGGGRHHVAICKCRDVPRLGEGRDRPCCQSEIREPVHGGDGLGRSERAGLRQTLLRLLGWRRHFPRACHGHGAGNLDLEERLEAGRSRLGGSERVLHGGGMDGSAESGEPVPSRHDPAVGQRPRLPVCRRHAFPADRRHLVGHADLSLPLARRRHAPSPGAGGGLQGVCRLSPQAGVQLRRHPGRAAELGQRRQAGDAQDEPTARSCGRPGSRRERTAPSP